ncbi:MAG TPA: 5-oxoprolinase subunit PxpA [Pseudomonadota bacterium]|nr:5-oxoprolinase subunit PxpA [Pseudomonadota bacterium]
MRATIDLNCDLGESYGAWRMGEDAAVLPLISSANVACGFHAGDPAVMRRTVRLAHAHGVAIGAHVSLPDLQGFGRRELRISADEAYELTLYQLGALHGFARAEGAAVAHVKPHGALYNMAARDPALAAGIAAAVHDFDPRLVLYGLAGSALPAAGAARGLAVAHEAFCDRSYEADGSLSPRSLPGAVLDDPAAAAAQLLALVRDGALTARDGSRVAIRCDSVCLHGDRPDAASYARHLRAALAAAGVAVAPPRA